MKTVILYATNCGTTEKCAKYLKERIGYAKCLNVEEIPEDFNLDDYDILYLGTNIRFFKFHKSMRKFIRKNKKTIRNKKVFGFLCGINYGSKDRKEKKFKKMTKAKEVKFVGGELSLEQAKESDKQYIVLLQQKFETKKQPLPQIQYALLKELADLRNAKL